jgi:hypothetical protein
MPSPFPGMDPYLETPDRWRNVHGNLATEIQTQVGEHPRPTTLVHSATAMAPAPLEVLITTDLP